MKIVSVIVFLCALVGTWKLIHGPRTVAESVHVGIQNDLKNIISEYIQKNKPNTKEVHFEKFWTETVNKSQVKAYFKYWFEDQSDSGETAAVEIDGSALLNKVDETPETVTWSFDQLYIADTQVTFTDPIQITAGTGELEGPSSEQTPKNESHQ